MDNNNENPNLINEIDLFTENENVSTLTCDHHKNYIASDLSKISLANHERQFENFNTNTKWEKSLSPCIGEAEMKVNSIEYRNLEEINLKNIKNKSIDGSSPVVVLSGSNLPINMKNVVKCRLFSAKKKSKSQKRSLSGSNFSNKISNIRGKGDYNPLKKVFISDNFSSKSNETGSVQHKMKENFPYKLKGEIGHNLNVLSNSVESTSITQNPSSSSIEMNTNMPISINENVNIVKHSKTIENICPPKILKRKRSSQKIVVNLKNASPSKYLPLKRLDLPSFVNTDSSDICEIHSNEIAKIETKDILSSALTVVSDQVTNVASVNQVKTILDEKHDTTILDMGKPYLNNNNLPLTDLPIYDTSCSSFSTVVCGEITGMKLPTEEDLENFHSDILKFHERQKVKEVASISSLDISENKICSGNVDENFFIKEKSIEETLKLKQNSPGKTEEQETKDLISEDLRNDISSCNTKQDNKIDENHTSLIEENSTRSLTKNLNIKLGLSLIDKKDTDCEGKILNVNSVEESSYDKFGINDAVDISKKTQKNNFSCKKKTKKKPKLESNFNLKFDTSKPYSYNNSSPLTFLQQNVLENVFKHESHPSSTHMGRLARFMKIQWKEVKDWFIARRLYDKQKGILPKNQPLEYCSHCSLSFLQQSHLFTRIHFNNVMIALKKEFAKFVNGMRSEDNIIEYNMNPSTSIEFYKVHPKYSFQVAPFSKGYCFNSKLTLRFISELKEAVKNNKMKYKNDKLSLQSHLATNVTDSKNAQTEEISILSAINEYLSIIASIDKIDTPPNIPIHINQSPLSTIVTNSKSILTEENSILSNSSGPLSILASIDKINAPQNIPIDIDELKIGKINCKSHFAANSPNVKVLHSNEDKFRNREYSNILEHKNKIYPLQNLVNASKMEHIKIESNHTKENTIVVSEHSNILGSKNQIDESQNVSTNIDPFENGKVGSQSHYSTNATDCYIHANENYISASQRLDILENQEIYPLQKVTNATSNVNSNELSLLKNRNFSEQLSKADQRPNYVKDPKSIVTAFLDCEASTDYKVKTPALCNINPFVAKDMHFKETMNVNDFIVGFRCPICKIIFQNEWMLIKHSLTHRKFICNDCEGIFETENLLLCHLKEHLILSMKPKYVSMFICYKCRSLDCICIKPFSSTNLKNYIQPRLVERSPRFPGINDHLQVTVQELVTEFDLNKDNCKPTPNSSMSPFQTVNDIKKTVLLNKPNTYSNVVTFNCNICESFFFTEYDLQEHLMLHPNNKNNFQIKSSLQPPEFRESSDSKEKYIFCIYCHVCYEREYQLRSHIRFRCRFAPKGLSKLLYSSTLSDLVNQGKGKHYYSISKNLSNQQIPNLKACVTKFCSNCKMEVNKDNFACHKKICLLGGKSSIEKYSKLPRMSNDTKLSNIGRFKKSRLGKLSFKDRNKGNKVKFSNTTRITDIPVMENYTDKLVNSQNKIKSCKPKINSTDNKANSQRKATNLSDLHIPKVKKSIDKFYICCYCEVPFYHISPLHYHLQNKCQNLKLSKELRTNLTILKDKDYQTIKISNVNEYYKQNGEYTRLKHLLDFSSYKSSNRVICKFCSRIPFKSHLFNHLLNVCKNLPEEIKTVFQVENVFIKSHLENLNDYSNFDQERGDVTCFSKEEDTTCSYHCHLCDESFKLSDKFIKHLLDNHNLKIEVSSAFKWLARNKKTMNDVQSVLYEDNILDNNAEILLPTINKFDLNYENHEICNSVDIPSSNSQLIETTSKNTIINDSSKNDLPLSSKVDSSFLEDYKIEDLCDGDLLGDVDNLDNFIETVQLNDNNFGCEEMETNI